MKELLAKIESQYANKLPFVAYRKPGDSEVHLVFQNDNKLHTINDYNECGFVFAPFNDEKESVLIPFENSFSEAFQANTLTDEIIPSVLDQELAKESHKKLVTKGVNSITKGTVNKVVLSRIETCSIHKDTPITLFKRALYAYSTAFVYVWYHPKKGCWLGATPEALLKIRDKQFKTMALAGTKLYEPTITWGLKEKEEQQIVADYIAKKLLDEGIKFKQSEPYTVQAGHLAHIRTDITGRFTAAPNVNLKKIISALHPTPAVCGFPKEKAKEFILENEDYDRLFYTGFLGELNKESSRKNNRRNTENKAYNFTAKTSELYVNLRCMQIKNNQALIYVGGGITASSDPEKEFLETCNKAKTMKKLIKS